MIVIEDESEATRIGAEMMRAFTHASLRCPLRSIENAIAGSQRLRVLGFLNVSRAKAKAWRLKSRNQERTDVQLQITMMFGSLA